MKKCRSSEYVGFEDKSKVKEKPSSEHPITIPDNDTNNNNLDNFLKNRIKSLQKQSILVTHQIQSALQQKKITLMELKSKVEGMIKKQQGLTIDRKTLIQELRDIGQYMLTKYRDADRIQTQLIAHIYQLKLQQIAQNLNYRIEQRKILHQALLRLNKDRQIEKKAMEMYVRRYLVSNQIIKSIQKEVNMTMESHRRKIVNVRDRWYLKMIKLKEDVKQIERVLMEGIQRQIKDRQKNKEEILETFEHFCNGKGINLPL